MSVSLRHATPGDSEFLFALRNDPEVRRNSFSQSEVSRAEHEAWLNRRLESSNPRLFVIEKLNPTGQNSTLVGVCRIDLDSLRTGVVTIHLSQEHRGSGFAKEALLRLRDLAAGDSDIDSLAAFTRPDNTASKRLFSRAGFVGPIWSKPNTLDAAPEHAWRFHLPLAFKRRHSPVDPRYVVACRTEWFWQALHARRDAFPGKIVEVRSESELAALSFETLNPRYIFFPHWSSKVPPNITSTYECVCFHGTDLPFGRGGSPVQNLIARGISESNLTALRMVEEFDAGPTYLRLPYSLQGSATDIFASMSGLTVEMMLHIALAEPEPISQEGPATNFKRRTPSQSNLEQASNDLDGWYDLIRMLDADGYPHAYIDVGNLRLNFRRASRKADHILADVTILERVKKK